MALFRSAQSTKAGNGSGQQSVELRHLTGDEFASLIAESSVPVAVDFWAEWCAPCHRLAPAMQSLAEEFDGRAVVAKLNADDYPEVLMHYGIMGIPTVIFFRGGQEADRSIGLTSYDNLKSRLERLL